VREYRDKDQYRPDYRGRHERNRRPSNGHQAPPLQKADYSRDRKPPRQESRRSDAYATRGDDRSHNEERVDRPSRQADKEDSAPLSKNGSRNAAAASETTPEADLQSETLKISIMGRARSLPQTALDPSMARDSQEDATAHEESLKQRLALSIRGAARAPVSPNLATSDSQGSTRSVQPLLSDARRLELESRLKNAKAATFSGPQSQVAVQRGPVSEDLRKRLMARLEEEKRTATLPSPTPPATSGGALPEAIGIGVTAKAAPADSAPPSNGLTAPTAFKPDIAARAAELKARIEREKRMAELKSKLQQQRVATGKA